MPTDWSWKITHGIRSLGIDGLILVRNKTIKYQKHRSKNIGVWNRRPDISV